MDYLQINKDINKALFGFYREENRVIYNEGLWFAYEKSVDVLSMLKHNDIIAGSISEISGLPVLIEKNNNID